MVVKSITVDLTRERDKITGGVYRVTFLNSGETPAYDVELRKESKLDAFALNPIVPIEAARAHRTTAIVGPRVEHPDDLGAGFHLIDNDVEKLRRTDVPLHLGSHDLSRHLSSPAIHEFRRAVAPHPYPA